MYVIVRNMRTQGNHKMCEHLKLLHYQNHLLWSRERERERMHMGRFKKVKRKQSAEEIAKVWETINVTRQALQTITGNTIMLPEQKHSSGAEVQQQGSTAWKGSYECNAIFVASAVRVRVYACVCLSRFVQVFATRSSLALFVLFLCRFSKTAGDSAQHVTVRNKKV